MLYSLLFSSGACHKRAAKAASSQVYDKGNRFFFPLHLIIFSPFDLLAGAISSPVKLKALWKTVNMVSLIFLLTFTSNSTLFVQSGVLKVEYTINPALPFPLSDVKFRVMYVFIPPNLLLSLLKFSRMDDVEECEPRPDGEWKDRVLTWSLPKQASSGSLHARFNCKQLVCFLFLEYNLCHHVPFSQNTLPCLCLSLVWAVLFLE